MFLGASPITLDAKGRMSIPVKYREALSATDGANSLVITAHPDRCLLLYTAKSWAPVLAQLVTFPSLEENSSKWRRILMGQANETVLDPAGRILLPPALRKYAGLEKDLMMVGQGNFFEIWNEVAWESNISSLDRSKGAPIGFENFSL